MKRTQSGFILVLAVMLVGMISVLVMTMATKTLALRGLSRALLQREQAKQNALSGLQIAIAQLSQEAPEGMNAELFYLQQMLMLLNRWQTFDLGLDSVSPEKSSCTFYISAELGKINPVEIVALSRLAEKIRKRSGVPLFEWDESYCTIGTAWSRWAAAQGMTFKGFEQLFHALERQQDTLCELTDLLSHPEYTKCNKFLFPSPSPSLALYDLFSVERLGIELYPELLSRSFGLIFGAERPKAIEKKDIEPLAEGFKKGGEALNNLLLQLRFGTTAERIPAEVQALFVKDRALDRESCFSVMIYGNYADMTIKLFAVLVKPPVGAQNSPPKSCLIKKIYWMYE